jgi:hypothetical protein
MQPLFTFMEILRTKTVDDEVDCVRPFLRRLEQKHEIVIIEPVVFQKRPLLKMYAHFLSPCSKMSLKSQVSR